MEELKRMLEAVELQLVLVIILGIINIIITHSLYSNILTFDQMIAVSASPLSILSMVLGLVAIAVVAWAGYVWTKESKGTAVDGGKAGALVYVITGIITGILNLIYISPVTARLLSTAGVPGMAGSGFAALSLVIGIVVGAIIGFILGAIGGFFAKGKK
jgi:hypothetical protein